MARDRPLEPRLGRFRLLGRIARGGMAEIYLARPDDPEATDAGAEVAVKRLLPELRRDREFLDMFRDEANLASKLDHPNVVRILEVGEDPGPDGQEVPFIAMELLRGVNLRDLLSRLQSERRHIPIELGVFIAIGALKGLAHAHDFRDEAGELLHVVHRDVSPQNVLLTYDGAVKLVDFGVAKAEGRLHQTRAGLIKGKFAYMSPEQVDGGELDGRSDLFALAEVIYELTLRRHPFYAEADMEVLRKILDEDPPHPRDLDPGYPAQPAEVLMRSLSKRPEDRYASAKAMADELSDWLGQQPQRPTSGALAQFVRRLFADRQEEEESARQTGNTDDLVHALQVGRAAPVGMVTDPPPAAAPATDNPLAFDDGSNDEELPTLLALNPEEALESLTSPPPPREPKGRPPRPESVRVGPAPAATGPRVVPSERMRGAQDPAEATGLDTTWPGHRGASEPVAPDTRGTTVRRETPASPPRRWDLVVFVTGLLALAASLVFAFTPSRTQATVQVRSKPTGARIWIDEVDTGRNTPAEIAYPTHGVRTVELRRIGFEPCTRQLSADDQVRRIVVECQLEPVSSSP